MEVDLLDFVEQCRDLAKQTLVGSAASGITENRGESLALQRGEELKLMIPLVVV